jgi:hypothetical protein
VYFEFQSKTYPTAEGMHRAIAEAWLEDGGFADIVDQLTYLASHSDEVWADEAIEHWLLDEPEWASPRAFSRSTLVGACAGARRERMALEAFFAALFAPSTSSPARPSA